MSAAIRMRVLAEARAWIGTPYRHQASRKGVGCDCLGLIRGIWRAIHGHEPELPPAYAPDWAERSGEDRLMAAAARHFQRLPSPGAALPGDLLLFRWRPDCAAKHAGILGDADDFIHAYEQAAVIRSSLVPSWRRRIAAVFRFPDLGAAGCPAPVPVATAPMAAPGAATGHDFDAGSQHPTAPSR